MYVVVVRREGRWWRVGGGGWGVWGVGEYLLFDFEGWAYSQVGVLLTWHYTVTIAVTVTSYLNFNCHMLMSVLNNCTNFMNLPKSSHMHF